MLNIAFINEYTTGSCTQGIVIYMVARECFEENSWGVGNGAEDSGIENFGFVVREHTG